MNCWKTAQCSNCKCPCNSLSIETKSLAIFCPAHFLFSCSCNPLIQQTSQPLNRWITFCPVEQLNHPPSQFSKGNQNHRFSIDPGQDQENLNPNTLGHFLLLLLRYSLCLLGWTDHTGWEQEEKKERLKHRPCSRKPSFASRLGHIFLFLSFFITHVLHCAQWSYLQAEAFSLQLQWSFQVTGEQSSHHVLFVE